MLNQARLLSISCQKKGSTDVGRIPNLTKERSTKGFYNLQNDNLNRGVYQFGLWRSFLLSRKCSNKLRKQKCRKTLQGQDFDCKGLRNHIIRKCIRTFKFFLKKISVSRKTIHRFLLKTYSFGGLIEPAAWTTMHTLGGGTSLEKYTSKNTPRKKYFHSYH